MIEIRKLNHVGFLFRTAIKLAATRVHVMIISLHMPKTAGTSFAASLEHHFGPRQGFEYWKALECSHEYNEV